MSSVELIDDYPGLGAKQRPIEDQPLSWPYVRDAVGVWCYEWGPPVPGAQDLTALNAYGFAEVQTEKGPAIAVPTSVWNEDRDLNWCGIFWDQRQGGDTIFVPLASWQARDEVVSMYAPELSPRLLVDTDGVAKMAGRSSRTISNYLARGSMPAPVARLGGSPVWPKPLIRHWLETRPGKRGRPRRRIKMAA
jgi:predicted DNA-binding transcriptional regulator AlpA